VIGGAVLAAALALILVSESRVPPPLGRGAKAPDFSLPTLDGQGRIQLSDLRGHVVLVNFWATWCKPCEDEMPSMERLYRRLHKQGFEILAVSVDEDPALVESFRERLSISFPIVLDGRQVVSGLYQTTGFPESLLIDESGKVVERYVGPRDWAIYSDRIQRLISAGPVL
jgi:peroxiredoxin